MEYEREQTTYTHEYFASVPGDAIVVHLTADGENDLDLTVGLNREQDARAAVQDDMLFLRGSVIDTPSPDRGDGGWGLRFEA